MDLYVLVTHVLHYAHRSVAEPTKEMLVLEVWYVCDCTLSKIAPATCFDNKCCFFLTGTVMNLLRQVVARSRDSGDLARKYV